MRATVARHRDVVADLNLNRSMTAYVRTDGEAVRLDSPVHTPSLTVLAFYDNSITVIFLRWEQCCNVYYTPRAVMRFPGNQVSTARSYLSAFRVRSIKDLPVSSCLVYPSLLPPPQSPSSSCTSHSRVQGCENLFVRIFHILTLCSCKRFY